MKQNLIICLLLVVSSELIGQRYYSPTSSLLPQNLYTVPVEYTNCATTPGTALATFSISDLPALPLSATNTVAEVQIGFDITCGADMDATQLILRWTDGVTSRCYYFFDGSDILDDTWNAIGGGITQAVPRNLPIYLRDPVSCGVNFSFPDFDQEGFLFSKTNTSNVGVYRAGCQSCGASQASSVSLASAFSGINPNGTWTIHSLYTGSNGGIPNGPPCLTSASLLFGNPTPNDRRVDGNSCLDAIQYNGTPFCASTNTKTGSNEMPGSIDGPNTTTFTDIFAAGTRCEWNNANNNDVWIKLNPGSGYFCINITGATDQLQSIVVEATTADGDTEDCTANAAVTSAGGDPNWRVVSCPQYKGSSADCLLNDNCTSGIYSGNQGSIYNQQHCFTSLAGKSYYLIIDGNGGATSNFYISGIGGPTPALLSDRLLSLTAEKNAASNRLKWAFNMDPAQVEKYEIQRSPTGSNFYSIFQSARTNPEDVFVDDQPLSGMNYYRLKVYMKSGSNFFSNTVQLRSNSFSLVSAFPNPVQDYLNVNTPNKIDHINVFNSKGQLIYTDPSSGMQSLRISTAGWEPGQYILVVTDMKGNTETIKVVK